MQLGVFKLTDEEYGVPIQFVKEIIRKPEITQLPNDPEFILGVILSDEEHSMLTSMMSEDEDAKARRSRQPTVGIEPTTC